MPPSPSFNEQIILKLQAEIAHLKTTCSANPSSTYSIGPSVQDFAYQLLLQFYHSFKVAVFFCLLVTGCLIIGFGVGSLWIGGMSKMALWWLKHFAPEEERGDQDSSKDNIAREVR